MNKGSLAGGGHTCCHTDHIGLGNAHIKGTVGIGLGELLHAAGTEQVRIQVDNILPGFCQLHQGFTQCRTHFHGFFFMLVCKYHCHYSATAFASSSSSSASPAASWSALMVT